MEYKMADEFYGDIIVLDCVKIAEGEGHEAKHIGW